MGLFGSRRRRAAVTERARIQSRTRRELLTPDQRRAMQRVGQLVATEWMGGPRG